MESPADVAFTGSGPLLDLINTKLSLLALYGVVVESMPKVSS